MIILVNAVLICLLTFSAVLFFIIASAFIGFWYTNIPFIKSSEKDFGKIILSLGVNKEDVIYDLGSGDGHILFHAERLTGAKVKGFEMAVWAYAFSRLKKKIKGSKAEFIFGDFFKADWSKATVLYFYLYPPIMPKVAAKIKAECKPGTTIISHDFPLSSLGAEQYFPLEKPHGLYVYKV